MAQKEHNIKATLKYRWIENGHIFLWLIKDTCWAMEYKAGGMLMIVPTISVAYYILWRSKNIRSEVFHNIAICLWILANSIWMIGEFFGQDTRYIAASMFVLGIALLIFYYLYYFKKDLKRQKKHLPVISGETAEPILARANVID